MKFKWKGVMPAVTTKFTKEDNPKDFHEIYDYQRRLLCDHFPVICVRVLNLLVHGQLLKNHSL